MKEQVLDSMDIERERGITIKAQTVRPRLPGQNGEAYVLNLIDTPGHVDFAYEGPLRSMPPSRARCLVVDATQGVEAQTLANVYQAIDAATRSSRSSTRSTCPPPSPTRSRQQIEDVIGSTLPRPSRSRPRPASASTTDVLEAIVHRPAGPQGRPPRRR